MGQSLNFNVFEEMLQEYQKLKEESIKEQEEIQEVKNQILNFDVSTLTESEIKFAEEISNTFLKGIDSELTPEQRGQLDKMTGRERISATGAIWGAINGAMVGVNSLRLENTVNIKGIISKVLGDTTSMMSFGNVIYRAIQNFKDGASADEVFAFLKDTTSTVLSGSKIIYSLYQIKNNPDIPGDSFLQRMFNYYTDTNSVNVTKVKSLAESLDVYKFNLNTNELGIQRYGTQFNQIDDIVAGRPTSTLTQTDIPDVGVSGTYRALDGTDKPFNSLDLSYEVPETNFQRVKSATDKAFGVAGLIVDAANLSKGIADIALAIEKGESVTPSQIMSVISAGLSTIGDGLSFGGPIAQVVGTVISGISSLIVACNGFAKLNSDSSPKDIGFAVSDFVSAIIPLAPSARAIEQAINYQKLYEGATNDADREIYDALHTIAALDATPIVNLFNFAYGDEIKEDAREKLMDTFGTFDNMMRKYITNDSDFSNQLNKVANFLKQNENTEHTQYITAYLTPDQVKSIFGDAADYRSGYDIRNVDSSLGVIKRLDGRNTDSLVKTSGLKILPVGQNLVEKDGRQVLDTISLGYGTGKTTEGRRVDTSTYLGYTKEALDMFREEFRRQHIQNDRAMYYKLYQEATDNGLKSVYWLMYMGETYHVNPLWEKPKVWIDMIDNISGVNVSNGNPMSEADILKQSEQSPIKLPNINNRVRAVATDVVYPNIQTGAGDDDVIFTDIVRSYSGADSKVIARADGGEGDDILDLSHMMSSEYKDEELHWNWSLKDNTIDLLRSKNDGRDLDLGFKNFETVLLGKGKNILDFKNGSEIINGKVQDLRIKAVDSSEVRFDLLNVNSHRLEFEGTSNSKTHIFATKYNDTISIKDSESGTNKEQFISGGEGNDYIRGGNVTGIGINRLNGDGGNDVIIANGLNNSIDGGSGNDFITGSSTNGLEVILGGEGNDIIQQSYNLNNSTSGNFTYNGGEGNDTIKLGSNNSNSLIKIDGGSGIDTLDLSNANINFFSMLLFDLNQFVTDSFKMEIRGIENIIATKGGDMINATDDNNVIKAGDGIDIVKGFGGDDIIYGDGGNDTLDGGNGNNILYGGEGADTFEFKGLTSYNTRIMDIEKDEKIIVSESDINKIEFNRHKYLDSHSNKQIDSLLLTNGEKNIELYDYFNRNLNNSLNLHKEDGAFDQNVISERIRNTNSGIQGEISEILNIGSVQNTIKEEPTVIKVDAPTQTFRLNSFVGTNEYNRIHGYDSYEKINGTDSSEIVKSRYYGNDIISAGKGDDTIDCFDGNKIVYLGEGSDDLELFDDVSANIKVMDFERGDKITLFEDYVNLQNLNFERHKYTDNATNEDIDSLCIKFHNEYVELYNWYKSGIEANELPIINGINYEQVDTNAIAEKIKNASNVSGERSQIVAQGAPAPAPMVDYNDINYSGLSSFSSNLGTVNF